MAVLTGMRSIAAKYSTWVPATPISAIPSTRQRPRHSALHRPRSAAAANGASTAPPISTRALTAAAGDQPLSSSGLMNAPDRPKEAAAITATMRPRVVWVVAMGCCLSSSECQGCRAL